MTTILTVALAIAVVVLAFALALALRSLTRASERDALAELRERNDAAGEHQARAYERLERELRRVGTDLGARVVGDALASVGLAPSDVDVMVTTSVTGSVTVVTT